MSTLNARGHEVVDPKPFEPTVPIRKSISVSDMVRAEIMRARQAAADEIKTDEDMVEDMTDFDQESFPDDGLIGPSPYEIPDEVPDGPLPLKKNEETPEAPVPVPEPTSTKTEENQ